MHPPWIVYECGGIVWSCRLRKAGARDRVGLNGDVVPLGGAMGGAGVEAGSIQCA